MPIPTEDDKKYLVTPEKDVLNPINLHVQNLPLANAGASSIANRAQFLALRRRKAKIALGFALVLSLFLLLGIFLAVASFKRLWPFFRCGHGGGTGEFTRSFQCRVWQRPHSRFIEQQIRVTDGYVAIKVHTSPSHSPAHQSTQQPVHVLHLLRAGRGGKSVIRWGPTCYFKRRWLQLTVHPVNSTDVLDALQNRLMHAHHVIPLPLAGGGAAAEKEPVTRHTVERVFLKRPSISPAVFRSIFPGELKAHMLCQSASRIYELSDTHPVDACPEDCRQFALAGRAFRCQCVRARAAAASLQSSHHDNTLDAQEAEMLRQIERARAKDTSWQKTPMNQRQHGEEKVEVEALKRIEPQRMSGRTTACQAVASRPKCSTMQRLLLGMLPAPIDPEQRLVSVHVRDCYGRAMASAEAVAAPGVGRRRG